MPAQLSYPGVYIEELSSGVRTITGVATSIAAFAGSAPRGPINQATRLFSFADYERRFGGLAADSEMGYAVRQFFQNGGTDAYAVRIVKEATFAERTLKSTLPADVLKVSALDAGSAGNNIEVRVDHLTTNPGSNFNISFVRSQDGAAESYANVSMNSADARYVGDLVSASSQLVKVSRLVSKAALDALPAGRSTSAPLSDVATLLDANHNEFRVALNNGAPVKVVIALPGDVGGATPTQRLDALCSAIQAQVRAQANSQAAYLGFTCARPAGTQTLLMTSGTGGESSNVRVLAGQRNNATAALRIGAVAGGLDVDAVASIRPAALPDPATLTSTGFGNNDLNALPDGTHSALRVSLDGYGPDVVDIGSAPAVGADLAAKLADVAARLQAAVRALKPGNPSYRDFSAQVAPSGTQLLLATGSRGAGASIAVSASPANSIASELHLLAGALSTQPGNVLLANGAETPYAAADIYPAFIADRASRQGLYALEGVDLFNILCLPGITDTGVLMDAAAYCEERRAFFVIDSAPDIQSPADMVASVSGTALPKSDHAAVYYPWVYIADPLKSGKLRLSAPCGTVAGLYARTDADRGVWKAPAGTEATLGGVQKTAYALTDGETGVLNPLGVNCLRVFPVYGAVVVGRAHTARRRPDELRIQVRARAAAGAVPRGKPVPRHPVGGLRAQRRAAVGADPAQRRRLHAQPVPAGRLPGQERRARPTSSSATRETTTQNDINLGIVNILVGFAPLKPAEFVVIRIQQMAGQIQA